MPIRPLRDLLYIIPIQSVSDTGTVIRPDTHQRKLHQGIVKYRGPETSGEIRRGDHVFFPGWEGNECYMEGEGILVLMREQGVDLVWRDGAPNELVPLENVRMLVQRVMAEIGRKAETTQAEQELIIKILRRFNERMDLKPYEELYF